MSRPAGNVLKKKAFLTTRKFIPQETYGGLVIGRPCFDKGFGLGQHTSGLRLARAAFENLMSNYLRLSM